MSAAGNIFDEIKARLSGEAVVRRDEPMSGRTTFRIGGKADIFVVPASENDLAEVLRICRENGVCCFVLGRGSNLLVRDGGIRGVVVSLSHAFFSRVLFRDGVLRCGGGAALKAVSAEALRNGVRGFEFMDGIPGSVGGALRMNAGANGSSVFDLVGTIRTMDAAGNTFEVGRAEIAAGYRSCPALMDRIVVEAVFRGETGSRDEILARTRSANDKRWASQPKEPSAGCIFKNPPAMPAGRLIDELGLKGAKVGGAAVSTVHANFIVNTGGATARDVLALIEMIREKSRTARGIDLETEVQIVGEDAVKQKN